MPKGPLIQKIAIHDPVGPQARWMRPDSIEKRSEKSGRVKGNLFTTT